MRPASPFFFFEQARREELQKERKEERLRAAQQFAESLDARREAFAAECNDTEKRIAEIALSIQQLVTHATTAPTPTAASVAPPADADDGADAAPADAADADAPNATDAVAPNATGDDAASEAT